MGGVGVVSPPCFAYDLSYRSIYRKAKIRGLQRYGRAPKSSDEDTRPLGLGYRLSFTGDFNLANRWTREGGGGIVGGAVDIPNPFNNQGSGLRWNGLDTPLIAVTNPSTGFSVGQNGAFAVRARLTTVPKGKPKIWFVRRGGAGKGFIFQIRDGKTEAGFLSAAWTLALENSLRALWALESPSDAQKTQIEDLQELIFTDFESLTLERGMGRDSDAWYNNPFTLTFIPEEAGRVHVILEGADATAVENSTITKTRQPGILWEAGSVVVGSAAGAWTWQVGKVIFNSSGTASYGPYKNGLFVDYLGDLVYAISATQTGGSVTFTQTTYSVVEFGFRATLTSDNGTSTPFVYGLRARLLNGPLNGSTEPHFDTGDLYVPVSGEGETRNPTLDIELSLDDKNGRSISVLLRDVSGRLNLGDYSLDNRVATAWVDDIYFITRGVIVETKRLDMANAKKGVAPIQQKRKTSKISLTIRDATQILEETKCTKAPVGDGLRLSDHIRAVLQLAGFTEGQMAGVPVGFGRRLPAAALGEDWATLSDGQSNCADYIRGLLDYFGAGLYFYQSADGVWTLREQDTTVKAAFSAAGGRYKALRPLDLISNFSDFYNHFEIIGGVNGELYAEETIWESINDTGPGYRAYWMGRYKPYETLQNTGLRSIDDLNWAMQSLKWRYAKPGRRAQFETYFHPQFLIGDRITIDNRLYEIEGISGASLRRDRMQMLVREVN